jgi:hypothetical protein
MGQILSFFMRNLQPGSDADHPKIPEAYKNTPGAQNPMAALPPSTFQTTRTGQVSSSYKDEETVYSLNKKRTAQLTSGRPALTSDGLPAAIRNVTGAETVPATDKFEASAFAAKSGPVQLGTGNNLNEGRIGIPASGGRHPAILFLVPDSIDADSDIARANKAKFDQLVSAGNVVLALTPRPSPPGNDDMKSPLLGPFYLLSLRAAILDLTLVGLRIDDVTHAISYLVNRADVDPAQISAIGSGHMGLVLLHAGVLDSRLKHITVDHVLSSFQSLVDAPLPIGASEDILPRVLLHYDLPDLKRALGWRLTATDWLDGTQDLSQTSTPLRTLQQ